MIINGQKQLHKHNPDNGVYGDCSRATLATLLDVPIEEVPHFFQETEGDVTAANDMRADWLGYQGYAEVFFAFDGESLALADVLKHAEVNFPGVIFLLCGLSGNGHNHEVLATHKGIAWDPAIDDSGIVGPTKEGYYWISVLVPECFRDENK